MISLIARSSMLWRFCFCRWWDGAATGGVPRHILFAHLFGLILQFEWLGVRSRHVISMMYIHDVHLSGFSLLKNKAHHFIYHLKILNESASFWNILRKCIIHQNYSDQFHLFYAKCANWFSHWVCGKFSCSEFQSSSSMSISNDFLKELSCFLT